MFLYIIDIALITKRIKKKLRDCHFMSFYGVRECHVTHDIQERKHKYNHNFQNRNNHAHKYVAKHCVDDNQPAFVYIKLTVSALHRKTQSASSATEFFFLEPDTVGARSVISTRYIRVHKRVGNRVFIFLEIISILSI